MERRALVGVRAIDGPEDDRDHHQADDGQQGGGPVRPARVVDGRVQGEIPDVEKEEDQLRGQARVPIPPGAPTRMAPQGAGPEGQEGEEGTGGSGGTGQHEAEPGVED